METAWSGYDPDYFTDPIMSLEAALRAAVAGDPLPGGMDGWSVGQIQAELDHARELQRKALDLRERKGS